jgi:hypothetical protein
MLQDARVPIPMCYFGLAYSAAWCWYHVAQTLCIRQVQINLQTAATD